MSHYPESASQLHPFLESFRTEHLAILSRLVEWERAGNWAAIFHCDEDVARRESELREERILFASIAESAEVRLGGPLCMLYYDMHLSSPALARAAAVCGQPIFTPTPSNVESHLKIFFDINSPVCLPIMDHLALAQIHKHARTTSSGTKLAMLGAVYMDILRTHFAKEDQCLLPMCQTILTRPKLDQLQAQMKAAAVPGSSCG